MDCLFSTTQQRCLSTSNSMVAENKETNYLKSTGGIHERTGMAKYDNIESRYV